MLRLSPNTLSHTFSPNTFSHTFSRSIISALFSRLPSLHSLLDNDAASHLAAHIGPDREKARKLAQAVASSRSPHLSHRVLVLAHELGCTFKQNAFESAAHQLALGNHWFLVLSVVSLGKQQSGRTTVRLLNWRTRALLETQHYASLSRILSEFHRARLKPTRRTFHLLISGHVRNHDLASAKICLQNMKEAGFPPDASTHALITSGYRALGADHNVQSQALADLHKLSNTTAAAVLNSILQLRIDTNDLSGARQILALFDQTQLDPHLPPLSGEIHTLADGDPSPKGHFSAPLGSPSPSPNATTFSILLNFMASRADLPGALRILSRMVSIGVTPTAATITSLVHVYFAAGVPTTAVRLVAEMCDPHTTPSQLFSPLLSTPSAGELPLAPSAIQPTTQVFNALLRGILPISGLNAVQSILRIMRANNAQPNATTLEIIITHLRKVEHLRPRTLLRVLRSLSSSTLRPTLRHLHVILSSILRHEKYISFGSGWNVTAAKFSPLRHHHSRLSEDNISGAAPASFDPAAGIEFPHRRSYYSLIRPILQSLSSRQIKSDAATISLRMRHDAVIKSNLETATTVFRTLVARGMSPNKYHFSALMEGFAQSGDLKAAAGVMKSAMLVGIKPNVVMFTILIVGHARQGNPDLAIKVFEDMVAMGIEPDVPSIDALSSAFFAVGQYAMARRILITLWAHVQPFPAELRDAPLKQLAVKFRSLHETNRGTQTVFTKEQRLILFRKLKGLEGAWKLRRGKRFGPKLVSNVPRTHSRLQKSQPVVAWNVNTR